MKRFLLIPLLIVLLSMFIIGGCAAPAPAPAPAPTPTPKPAPAPPKAPVKPVVIKWHSHQPPTTPINSKTMAPYLDELEKRSGGRLKIERYWGGVLGKRADVFINVTTGVVDLAWIPIGYIPGRFNLTRACTLSMFPMTTYEEKVVFQEFADTSGFLAADYLDVEAMRVWLQPMPALLSKKEIRKPEEIKGTKVWTSGGLGIKALQKYGATPANIPAMEIYLSVETGLLEGVLGSWPAHTAVRSIEVLPYGISALPSPRAALVLAMSKRAWNLMDEELRQIVKDVNGKFMSDLQVAFYEKEDARAEEEYVNKWGGKLYKLSPEEWDAWAETVASLAGESLAAQEAKGFLVSKVYKGWVAYLNAWRQLQKESKK
ncbi:TRAP transporter substrate-binding protein DctP [Chloroflexota bacterium]